jgi:two-component system, chemotaxis family, response regulator Rcp1
MTATAPIEILLVEDNPADVRLIKEALRETNSPNHLQVATDGEQILDILRERSLSNTLPDLIILDLNLPRKSGHEVLAIIKKDPILGRIPVIVLTTSNSASDIASVYDLRGNCYVQKPDDFEQLVQIIKSIEHFWQSIAKLPPKADAVSRPSNSSLP